MPRTSESPFTLHNAWQPSLKAGKYDITISHEVEGGPIKKQVLPAPPRSFDVQAPRLTLDPTLVQATYPVPGAVGDLSRVLPHLSLSRPTLPWERSPQPDSKRPAPWLALLLLTATELPPDPITGDTTRSRPVTQMEFPYSVPPDPGILLPSLAREPVRVGSDTCRTIDLPRDVFLAVVPRLEELPYLAHVRCGTDPGNTAEATAGPNDRAVVLANRLPRDGTYSAHLVSLEGLGQWLTTLPDHDTINKGPVTTVRLVSLYSWTFTTDTQHGNPGYITVARDVATKSGEKPLLRLSARQGGGTVEARVARRLESGYVPVPHQLPTGERTHAWYRGPFVPLPAAPLPVGPTGPGSEAEAMIYLPADGVFDVSYAAAFALGKLLGLAKPDLATTIGQLTAESLDAVACAAAGHATDQGPTALAALRDGDWVRRSFEASLSGRQPSRDAAAGQAPGLRAALAETSEDGTPLHQLLDQLVADTLTTRGDALDPNQLLAAVPFAHLVPDARLLPPETARFFHVDQQWISALTAGMLSLGAGTRLDTQLMESLREKLLDSTTLPKAGMLLRSILVRDWPGLIISAEDSHGNVRGEVRVLAPDLLLAYFTTIPTTVRIRQPTEAPHFGLDGDWYIELRHLKAPNVGKSMGQDKRLEHIEGMLRAPQQCAVLDIGALVPCLQGQLVTEGEWDPTQTLPPAAVALQLIDTPGELLFALTPPQDLDGCAS